jgi:hypothetical protein
MNAHDRCDRCGARAVVTVMFGEDHHLELMFCAHHAKKHGFAEELPQNYAAASGTAGESF